jgi:putative ABC transport system permease protein
MKLFFRFAHRNIFRNRIRTLVAVLAIATGSTALIVNAGIVVNIFRELREDAIHGRLGHIQVYQEGYSDHHLEDPERFLIGAAETARILALSRGNPRVYRATREREFSGLIENGDRRAAFVGLAVDPADDAAFSGHTELREGTGLSPDRPFGVLAGVGLARKLGARPGDALVLMTTTGSGVFNAVHVVLNGVFEGGLKEYDDWTLKMPFTAAAQLLLDERSQKIVVLLNRTEDVDTTRTEFEASFRSAGMTLETRSWSDLAIFHNQVVGLFGRELDIIRLIVAAIVILGIGNTIGMSIIERSVELATLRALGLRKRTVTALLATEAFLIGSIGAAIGVAAGIAIAALVNHVGIDYPSPPGSTRPFLGGVDLATSSLVEAFVISLLASLAAAALPIWRIMRQPIASVLRHG